MANQKFQSLSGLSLGLNTRDKVEVLKKAANVSIPFRAVTGFEHNGVPRDAQTV